ncbi:glycosyltransferase family 2 protein [Paenibacillus crassostreae]|uniref:Glycosyl transferase family 2 n=1 Tax=Paenibacillus crassostreae TaxID=1763538 RepID=A0A167D8V2_9BACL|nr:glycosyltransferase family 2 protein [Paenibacillus crassostreae]AOZ93257.1 glycosyl transferase family 2 [Paenibacillus crassostreae]OAB74080.1 glycosyl transferase family 2 [Paenibacillus crassostreae]
MPLLSIVIPVYNVENYIDECLESILNQTFYDWEVWLVDNASTDKSGEICNDYAGRYTNIKVIHLEVNLLPAGARNVGLQAAKGEYVHFCDSDDHYIEGSFSRIATLLKSNSPTVLMGKFICEPEKGAYVTTDVQLDWEVFKRSDANGIAEYFLRLPNLLCTPWRMIVKREFLISNNLTFPEGYHSEDEEWVPKVICSAESFDLLTEPFYCYRPRAQGSITSVKTYHNSKSHLVVALNLLRFSEQNQYEDSRKDLIYSRVRFLIGLFSTRCDTLNREQILELADIMEQSLKSLPINSDLLQRNGLWDFINHYGAYVGISLYRIFVIENTIQLVHGQESKDIYIFPTGYNGEATARILRNAGYSVKGFLDNSDTKNGHIIEGLPVCLPNSMKDKKIEDIFVVVSIQQERTGTILMNQLRDIGLNDNQFTRRIY